MIDKENPDRGRGGATPRRSGLPRGRIVAAWLSVGLVAVLVAAALTAYAQYRSVWNSIDRISISGLDKRPAEPTGALNILLIGSDSRAGGNRSFGAGITGQRSDSILILHIYPGHRGATVLSIPRDSMVPILACAPGGPGVPGQQADPAQRERINATYAYGGPACLWKTIESQTGIRIDHFIALTFTGFERIVNDIGGVDICLPQAVDDPDSGLHLSAGLHHVMGPEALAFWRERHIGTGSDLQRIARDQYLMASLVQGIERADILGNPSKLYSIAVDAASAMTTDSGLDLGTMLRIAGSLRGLSSRSVDFVQVPVVPYPLDPGAEVIFRQPQAGELFSAIARDTALPPHGPGKPGNEAARAPRAGSPTPTQPASPRGSTPAPAPRSPSASASGGNLNRAYGGISGNAQVCHDRGAFTGGDAPSDFSGSGG
jgi:LCP family protein required for cell wall assembly